MVILAVQAVLLDAQTTMSLLGLTESQKNFAMFMMNKSDLIKTGNTSAPSAEQDNDDGREIVAGNMVKMLSKATHQQE